MDAETEHPSLLNHRQKKHCLTKPPQQLQFLPFTIECSDMGENHSYSSLHGWHADVWTHGLWGTEAQQHCVLQPISEVSLNLSQKCVWRTGRRRHFVQANVHLEAVHAPRTLLETTQTQRFFIFFFKHKQHAGIQIIRSTWSRVPGTSCLAWCSCGPISVLHFVKMSFPPGRLTCNL